MRRSQASYLLTITALFVFCLGALTGWLVFAWLPQATGPGATWGVSIGLALLLVGSAAWLQRFLRAYFFQIKELNDEAQLILHTNLDRRVTLQGPVPLRTLTTTLNHFADRLQTLQRDHEEGIRQARADLEEEHKLLVAIMAELTDSVIVCNLDGRILLYNQRSRHLLNPATRSLEQMRSKTDSGYLGLGRSIFGLIDRNAITYGLSHLQSRLSHQANRPETDQSTGFITTAANGALLRIRLAPLLTQADQLTGFVLTLQDMTQGMSASSRRDRLLQRLTERFRGGLANIRLAIETLAQFPTMPPTQAERLQQVIQSEATTLSHGLDQTMREFADDLRAQWRYEEMNAADLLRAIAHHVTNSEAITVELREPTEPLWLRVDHYAVVHGMATAVHGLKQSFAIDTIHLSIQSLAPHPRRQTDHAPDKPRRFAGLDVRWGSGDVSVEAWLNWKEQVSVVDAGDATLTLREVAEWHGGEVWFQHDPAQSQSYFRLLLPLMTTPPLLFTRPQPRVEHPTIAGRPEYYDFDLFHQAGQQTSVTERLLTDLTYTVFDTETTGLDPATDRIVAIGAVRMLNGRLLRQEIFDQLVDPERLITAVAERVHGISNATVRGQPVIEQVLPHFMRFAEETVLIGHNVAFDMRMFEFEEATTDVKVTNPVLDTLLLSAVLHPDLDDHTLEGIAQRMGVNIFGRHTALGDAFVTAEIFLRMIPLLNAQGIHTLGDALQAAQKTYFARLKY